MEPSVGSSIAEGFRSANRGIPGIVFFGIGWLIVSLLMVLLVGSTGVPEGLSWPPLMPGGTAAQAPPAGDLGVAEPAAGTVAGDAALAFGLPGAAAIGGEARAVEADRQAQLIVEWLGRSWPMLMLAFLVMMIGNLWLQGGQIGYLAQVIRTRESKLSEFWITGTQAFRGLVGAWLIILLANMMLAILFVLQFLLLSLFATVMPDWVVALLGFLLVGCSMAALIWLGVRLACWFIGIVVDRVGPIKGLKATFRATRGRWWKVLGLAALLMLIFYAVSVIAGLVGAVGSLVGGAVAIVMGLISVALNVLANLYFGFVTAAAFIRFYSDATSSPGPAPGTGEVASA